MVIGRHFKRRSILLKIGICGAILALTSVYFWSSSSLRPTAQVHVDETTIAQSPLPEETVYSLPARLVIPALNINAPIDYMGVTPVGDMESPSSAQSVGWYKYGSRPGNVGNAVIAGHLGLREQSVFMDLDELQVGDELMVIDDQGQSVLFVVKQTRVYNKDDKPDEVFTASDTSHLNLITCAGDWIESEQTYAERLVVFADKSS